MRQTIEQLKFNNWTVKVIIDEVCDNISAYIL